MEILTLLLGILLGGAGTELWRERRAVSLARRVRQDEERENALRALVAACGQLETHVDFMLSPSRLSEEGVFQTNTMIAAEGLVRKTEDQLRTNSAPFLARAQDFSEELSSKWHDTERALDRRNPPDRAFFDRLRDLRAATALLRQEAQTEVMTPKQRKWRTPL